MASVLQKSSVEMVMRYRCASEHSAKFIRELNDVLSEWRVNGIRICVLQAMFSPEPTEWEVRLEAQDMRMLGAFIHEEERAQGILGRLTSVESAELVSNGVPLYRRWSLEAGAQSDK